VFTVVHGLLRPLLTFNYLGPLWQLGCLRQRGAAETA
jgi:hypothetical protein